MSDHEESDNEFEDSLDNQDDINMDRLTEILERLVTRQDPRPPTAARAFKPPEYDGKGDVEFFIRQFHDVSDANDWDDRAELLHLRTSLKEGAQDCGKAADVRSVIGALRARYGTSPREARSKLLSLKKDYKTGLQEHAASVEGLVELAFADLPLQNRQEMTLETFSNTLGNSYLQRHLLAIRPGTIEEAVRAGNEFLQIRTPSAIGVRAVLEEDEEEESAVKTQQTKADPMEAILAALTQLTKEVEQLKRAPPTRKAANPSRPCWGCGREGHFRNNCPNPTNTRPAGNGRSPQQ